MKKNFKFSKHLKERIEDRGINEKWINDTIENPDRTDEIADNEVHFFKKIIEFSNKCLKVVVNPLNKVIVTAFFDRKMTKRNCI